MARSISWLALCAWVAGCGGYEGTVVIVNVDATSMLSDVVKLHASLSAGTRTREFDVPLKTPSFPPSHNFGIDVPSSLGGSLDVHVAAIDSAGTELASGDGNTPLAAGQRHDIMITLVVGGNGDGGADQAVVGDLAGVDAVTPGDGPINVVISPQPAMVKAGRVLQLSANLPVTWSVMEGSTGGTIDSSGLYSAPLTPGTYHAVAVSQADAGNLATATITVQPLALDLVAGGLGGTGNVDGIGSVARLQGPTGAATDGAGNLYLADGPLIRKMVISTHEVTTLAGAPGATGIADGIGSAARFNEPRGMVTDGLGNLFVADYAAHSIRKIVLATGAVTTFAGTPGTSGTATGTGTAAQFNRPRGLASDSAGRLFVTDSTNAAVRAIELSTGIVSNFAGLPGGNGTVDGTGTAGRFWNPLGLTSDGTNLYLPDNINYTLRKIVISTAVVSTLAGTVGTSGTGDGTGTGAQFDRPAEICAVSGNVYMTDDLALIRRVNPSNGAVQITFGNVSSTTVTDGVGTGAGFSQINAMAADGAGNLYLGDVATIRVANVGNSVVTTVAGQIERHAYATGSGTAVRFYGPQGLVNDGTNLYVGDGGNSVIRKIVIATGETFNLAGQPGSAGTVDGTGTGATLYAIQGLALDGTGNLYVASSVHKTIRKVSLANGAVQTVAGQVGSTAVADGTGTAAHFDSPAGLASDGTNLYISERYNHTIRQMVLSSGVVSTLAGSTGVSGTADGTGTGALFGNLLGLAADGSGNLYVADTGSIRKIVVTTGEVSTLAGITGTPGTGDGIGTAARFWSPQWLTLDTQGNLYVTENNMVRRVVPSTGEVTTMVGKPGSVGVLLAPLPAGLSDPRGITATPNGDLYVGSENSVLVVH